MGFTFYKDELLRALKVLEPYAGHTQTDLDSEPYFGDKVVFGFYNRSCNLQVCHEDSQISIFVPYFHDTPDSLFCMELKPLIKTLEHVNAQTLTFEEEPFFGFLVYSAWQEQKIFLFEIKAFSARKIKGYKISNSSSFEIRKSIFVSLLSDLYKYTNKDELKPCNRYIWFYGNGEKYIAVATDGHKLSYRKGKTIINENFSFAILGTEVPCLLETLNNVGERLILHSELDNNIIYAYDRTTGAEINILHFLPDVTKRIDLPKFIQGLKSESVHSALVFYPEILNAVKRISEIENNNELFLHFKNGHVNIHSYDEDFEQISCSEFYETQSNIGDFIVRQNTKTLLLLLENINTILVRFCVDSHGYLHIMNEREYIYRETDRFACGYTVGENERKVVERKDFELAKYNENYRKNIFVKQKRSEPSAHSFFVYSNLSS